MDIAKNRRRKAKNSRTLRRRRKENGLCVRCGQTNDTQKTKCLSCLEKCRELERQNDRKTKQRVISEYGGQCACCEEDRLIFLTIDHKNNDGADHRRSVGMKSGGRRFYKFIIRNGYPDYLQVLCWNCNMGKHLNGGVCPHEED